MVSGILKSNRPFVIILAIISGIALWSFTLFHQPVLEFQADTISMLFYKLLIGLFKNNILFLTVFAFILVIIQGLLLVWVNQKFILINFRTFLPAFFYIIISSSFVAIQMINPILIGNFFIFFALFNIYKIYRSDYALNDIYIAGFFTAIASLFWAPFAIFILLIWIALIILRPFIGREWIVSILGFLTPIFFTFLIFYVFFDNNTLINILNNIKLEYTSITDFKNIHLSYILFYSLLFLIILIASLNLISSFQNRKIKTRKYFVINFWYFIIGLGIFLFFKRSSFEIIYILSIPISYLLSDYFYSFKKNHIQNAILILLYAGLIYIQIAHFGK
ncbi:MAG: hypothetical protein A2041_04840 [Bacteroidetes bacterium GWA2_31_9b]|nr:MAG: hypothetical protein A2041_04840 [Bacteroidetes bacterium GWA2_31_9b]